MRRRGAAVVVLGVGLFGATACGDDGGAGSASRDTDRPVATMLAALPDTDALAVTVIVNDLAGAREVEGIDPDDADDEDEVVDDLLEIAQRSESVRITPSEFSGSQSPEVDAWEDELGVTVAQVDRDVTAGFPPDHVQVVDGRFDPDAVADAVEGDDDWNDALDEDEVDGVTVYSWLDDEEIEPERATPTRRIGESARLALLADDRLAWARTDDAIEEVITAETTLADREDLGEVATVLDEAEVVTALLSAAADPGDDSPVDDHEAYGVGEAVDEDGDPQLVIALWHETEDEAEDAVADLEDLADSDLALGPLQWKEVDVERIEQDGRIALVVVGIEQPGRASRLVFAGDPLLLVGRQD